VKHPILFRLCSLLLASFCLIGLFSASAPQAEASIADELAAGKNKLAQLEKEQKALADKYAALQKTIKDTTSKSKNALKVKEALDQTVATLESQIENAENLLAGYATQILAVEQKISALNTDIDEQYELFKQRVAIAYENGEASYLEILFGSESLSDLLVKYDLIRDIAAYDRQIIDQYRQTKTSAEELRGELTQMKASQENTLADLEDQKADVIKQRKKQESYIKELESDLEAAIEAEAQSDAEMERIQKEIAKQIAENTRLEQSQYVGGEFLWPCPGRRRVTCVFGPRIHPVTKKKSNHTGVDIGADTGDDVVASNDGTVITAGCNYAYGNYVVIDHGGGVSTLYAHASKLKVKKGQKVKRGQVIMLVGSTGYSTGPHLHYEIILKDGVIDPLTKFDSSQYYIDD